MIAIIAVLIGLLLPAIRKARAAARRSRRCSDDTLAARPGLSELRVGLQGLSARRAPRHGRPSPWCRRHGRMPPTNRQDPGFAVADDLPASTYVEKEDMYAQYDITQAVQLRARQVQRDGRQHRGPHVPLPVESALRVCARRTRIRLMGLASPTTPPVPYVESPAGVPAMSPSGHDRFHGYPLSSTRSS